ncbi:hypothetical protein KP79_PYT02423 [Mizuhopecten yessoensis]|uniref:Rho termination factor N-terminal domain-containing protein n=1 Tax=Mizuhopecten yessoensis TaxID=6573 RepID=A0A210PKL2_MIZYE|nr:hypothetical protein KP79_PYT02423 [Mizuhopecten yessoensis]
MANRDNLNKLGVDALKLLASENNIATEKKKKSELVSQLLDAQAPVSALTPVLSQVSGVLAVSPNIKENLPPFNQVTYGSDLTQLPTIKFNDIYEFMILHPTDSGSSVKNFRGLDRATKHYDAGDVQEVSIVQVL